LACVESSGWGIAIAVFPLPRDLGVNAVWEDEGGRVSNNRAACTDDYTLLFDEIR